MKRILFSDMLIMLSLYSAFLFFRKPEPACEIRARHQAEPWDVYYGELNESHSWVQVDTGFYFYNSEFLLIGPGLKGYAIIDTCAISKADSLIPALMTKAKRRPENGEAWSEIEKIPADSDAFVMRFLSGKKAGHIYRFRKNGEIYKATEWHLVQEDTIPVMWTGRNRFTTTEKIFKRYLLP